MILIKEKIKKEKRNKIIKKKNQKKEKIKKKMKILKNNMKN